jgi:3-phosphoshikimate 1-carboxyvinyltransferase
VGSRIERIAQGVRVHGGLRDEPDEPLDLGNSGTATRLFAGVCAARDGYAVLTGDRYLHARPVNRVTAPCGPWASAILLAGLSADGRTSVLEPVVTGRHTEDMLHDFGAEVVVEGRSVSVERSVLAATDVDVPGDPSAAAFWIVAGLSVPDASVTVENVYLGPGRIGFADVLRRMGAQLDVDPACSVLPSKHSPPHGIDIGPDDIPSIIDEVPIIAVAAASATGTTTIRGAEELRVKESDRITSTVRMLQAFGTRVRETSDGMIIEAARSRTRPRSTAVETIASRWRRASTRSTRPEPRSPTDGTRWAPATQGSRVTWPP